MMVVVRENAFYLPKFKNFFRKVTFSLGKQANQLSCNSLCVFLEVFLPIHQIQAICEI